MPKSSRVGGWIKNIADIAVIVLIVLAAKTAIAEPFYVPWSRLPQCADGLYRTTPEIQHGLCRGRVILSLR